MNPAGHPIPRRTWTLLVFAVAWLSVVIAIRYYRPVGTPAILAEVSALRAELAALPPDADRRLAEWRQAHPPETNERPPVVTLDARWVSRADADTVIYGASKPETLRWPDIVGAVEGWERSRADQIQAIRIETAGTRTLRVFRVVEVTVRNRAGQRPLNPVRRAEEPSDGPGSGRESAGRQETGSGPLPAVRSPPPVATPETGSGSRTGVASGPATFAPASERFIPATPKT